MFNNIEHFQYLGSIVETKEARDVDNTALHNERRDTNESSANAASMRSKKGRI